MNPAVAPGTPAGVWDGQLLLGILRLASAVATDLVDMSWASCESCTVYVSAAACLTCASSGPVAAGGPGPASRCPRSGSRSRLTLPLALQQQNFKQKVVALLRRFKVSEEVSVGWASWCGLRGWQGVGGQWCCLPASPGWPAPCS